MKTNITKFLFVALSLVLVLSLFACNGDKNETDAPAGNESTEAIDNETTAAVGGETEETTGAPCTHTEETVAAVAPTCTETGLTEGKKCADCGEILVAQETVAALGHTEETIEAVPSTCNDMTADANGNIDLNFLRISFTNELAEVGGTGHNYLDIDFVAFATELSALENYAAAN